MKTYILNSREEMEAIIHKCSICMLGINDDQGSPYVIPMNFAYYQGNVILHSAPFGRHLDLIARDNRVTISFCDEGRLVYQHVDVACSYRMESRSVICRGEVGFVDDLVQKEELLNVFMRKYSEREFKYSLPALRNVKVWLVTVSEMSARSFGQKHR